MSKYNLVEELGATAELLGKEISPRALAMMAEVLGNYPADGVAVALMRIQTEGKFFTLPAIIDLIPGGWLGAEEAWATFPKDEAQTAVLTQEALTAWGAASGLYEDGDKIGARMAFKEAYQRLVGEARASNPVPKYKITLGHDPDGREGPILAALEKGLLTTERAQNFLPDLRDTKEPKQLK